MHKLSRFRLLLVCSSHAVALSLLLAACESNKIPEPSEKATAPAEKAATTTPVGEVAKSVATAEATAATTALAPVTTASAAPVPATPSAPKIPARPVAAVPVADGDPVKGVWSLSDAVSGLAKEGQLTAVIDTEKGKLDCELWDDKAPLTVANFIGLARGLRPWKNLQGNWAKKPLYDGTVFHRIIKGFMIQGGDPKGNGSGDAGYVIPDEIWENGSHNERGLLCMANRGPNTNSAQFFILDAPSTYLDGKYTIFGKCAPGEVIESLASQKVAGDKAISPPKIKKISIERRKPKP